MRVVGANGARQVWQARRLVLDLPERHGGNVSKPNLNFRSVLGVRKLHATLALAWYDRVHYVQDVLGHTGPLQEGYHPRSARMPESFVHAE